jgi:hypothetical protein
MPFDKRAQTCGPSAFLNRESLDESRYISDLTRKEVIQELVLNKENGIFSLGQISRERGLSCGHFAA